MLEEDLHLRAWNDAEFVGHVETLYATLWVYAMLSLMPLSDLFTDIPKSAIMAAN